MKKFILQWLNASLLLSLLISGNALANDDWTIVVDASGSMKGFFAENEIQNYVSHLENKIEKKGYKQSSKMFRHNLIKKIEHGIYPFNPNIKGREYGNFTDLNILYDDLLLLKSKAVIVITDNLMATTTEIGATEKFYARLASDDVKSIYIVPKLFKFKGSKLPKGMLVYAILFDDKFENEFKDVRTFFGAEELLLVKPLTNQEIVLKGVNPKNNPPNAVIGKGGVLQPNRNVIYQMDSVNRIKFNFSLSSNLSHVKINGKSSKGDEVHVGITDLKILTNNKNVTIKRKGLVTPDLLQGNLESKKSNNSIYEAKIDFVPTLTWGLSDAWSMVNFNWSNFAYDQIKLKTSFNINIDVPSSCFSLTKDFNDRYFTKNKNESGKIYSDSDILNMINTKPVAIKLHIKSK